MTEIPVISVDSGIPIPEMAQAGLPLDTLKAGESILFPVEYRSKVQIQASRLKRRGEKEFTVRKENDKCRIWRTK